MRDWFDIMPKRIKNTNKHSFNESKVIDYIIKTNKTVYDYLLDSIDGCMPVSELAYITKFDMTTVYRFVEKAVENNDIIYHKEIRRVSKVIS